MVLAELDSVAGVRDGRDVAVGRRRRGVDAE
jgi:hypothetical protein